MATKSDPNGSIQTEDLNEEWLDVDTFLETLELESGLTGADIGCGIPYYTVKAADTLQPGRLYAVDIQSDRLDTVEDAANTDGLTNIMPMRTGDRGIPVPDGSIDVAWTAGAFHTFDAPDGVLRDVQRMLKPDGSFFLIDWKAMDTPSGPPLRNRAPLTTLLKVLREAGFERLRNHDVFEFLHCVEAMK